MSLVGEIFIWRSRLFRMGVLETANGAWKREMKKIRDQRVKGKSLTDALLNMPLGHDKKKWENICLAWQSEEYKVYLDFWFDLV